MMWIVYGLMTLFVLLTRERTLLDSQSFLRHRYAGIPWLMVLHGVPGTAALVLGVFQFSAGLRQRHLQMHRVMGRIYVGGVAIAAPVGMLVSYSLPPRTLFMASVVHATGWLITTATALYCVKAGLIQQHREWMMRSYPFAMVFIVARAISGIPAIERMGPDALSAVVWSVIATACFLPSYVIEWQKLERSRKTTAARVQVQATTSNG